MERAGADIEMGITVQGESKQLIDGRALIIIDDGKSTLRIARKLA